jgi:hypothetical protein
MADIGKIVRLTDQDQSDSRDLPPDISADVAAHRRVAALVRTACASEPSAPRLAFLGERVLANARERSARHSLAGLAEAWRAFSRRPLLAYGSTLSVLVIAVAAALFTSRLSSSAEATQMGSFVIYQTDDGNAFVRYFDYQEANQREDADEAS